MNIIPIIPQGFCKGVIRAIQIAKNTRLQNPNKTITVLGMIVHNQYIVEALKRWNIQTIDDTNQSRVSCIDQILEGIVILTAHGTSEEVTQKALKRGLEVVDATCLDVVHTKKRILTKLHDGYEIIYLGKRNHPESNAMLSLDSTHIHLVSSIEEANTFHCQTSKVFVTNQTTMSLLETQNWIDILRKKYPFVEVEEEICNATRLRQEAVLQQTSADAYLVVGDPHSNNTKQLANLAKKHDKPVFMIETVRDLEHIELSENWTIAITSGASTPSYLTNQVIDYLRDSAKQMPSIDLDKVI